MDLGCGRLRRGARGEGRGARGEGGLCEASGSLGPERARERTGRRDAASTGRAEDIWWGRRGVHQAEPDTNYFLREMRCRCKIVRRVFEVCACVACSP